MPRRNGARIDPLDEIRNGVSDPVLDVSTRESLDPERFPHTLEVRPPMAEFVSDAQFSYGLERVLDGIACARPRTQPSESPDDGNDGVT